MFSADLFYNWVMSWHGFFSFVAVATAVLLVGRWAPLYNLDPDDVLSVAVWAIIGGVLGARVVHVIDNWELDNEIANLLGPRLGSEVEKIHYYEKWTFERFRIGCYEDTDDGFFKAHRDNFNEALKDRRYAVSINLNAEEYEGGDLRFLEYGHDLYRPPTGGAVVFSCSLLHEVLPVTKGRRFVFLTFLGGSPKSKGNAGSG